TEGRELFPNMERTRRKKLGSCCCRRWSRRRKGVGVQEVHMTSRHDEQKLRHSLLNSTTATTYHAAAALHETLDSGAGVVIGSTPIPNYPAASAPWNSALPPEAPLGYPIDAAEPVGEVFEVQQSIEAHNASDAVHGPDATTSADVVAPASSGGEEGDDLP